MIRIYVPRPYQGPHPVEDCHVCGDKTTCKKDGKFHCSVCQHFKRTKRERKVAA